MADNTNVTVDFELPHGIEYKGTTLKTGVMRRLTTGDIIATSQDGRMKQLVNSPQSINDDNPVAAIMAMGATYLMFHFIFSRTVVTLGDLPKEKITREIFKDMFSSDMQYLMGVHNDLNEMNIELPEAEGGDAPPLA